MSATVRNRVGRSGKKNGNRSLVATTIEAGRIDGRAKIKIEVSA
jgi:hypothetical protein